MTDRAEQIAAALHDVIANIVGESVACNYALKIGYECMAERADNLATERDNPPTLPEHSPARYVSCEEREAEEDRNHGPAGEDYWRGCDASYANDHRDGFK